MDIRKAIKKSYQKVIATIKQDAKIYVTGLVILALVASIPVVLTFAGGTYFVINKVNPFSAGLWSWIHSYRAYPFDHERQWYCLFFSFIVIDVLTPLSIYMMFNKQRELHGSARFAENAEINKAGLYADDGIVVGKYKGRLMKFPGQQFVLLSAPTRSGKGVGIVIPNCLFYNGSMVILDIKQENYNLTAGYRKDVMGQEVYLFNPFAEDKDKNGKEAPRTHRYNLLSSVPKGHFRIGAIQDIGNALWPGEDPKSAFWDDSAKNMFLGIVLYLFEYAEYRKNFAKEDEMPELPITMGEVFRQASGGNSGKDLKLYLTENVLKINDKPNEWLSSECRRALQNVASASDDVLKSVQSTFFPPLNIYQNKITDAATSANDFDLRDVRKKRMTIYIGITPDKLGVASKLLNVIFSQMVNLNTKELPQDNPALKYQCLLLMDEFTSIGKVSILAKAVSYIAGYNLRLMPIIQSLSQLESAYGKDDARTFATNHAMQIIYAPREQNDANQYSEMLGYYTEKSASQSRPKGFFAKGGSPSESISDQKRALMLPQELKEIGMWKEIILLENTKPILCEKIKYFEDPMFMERLLKAPSVAPLDIDLFIAVRENRTRELSDADLDYDKLCIKDPPVSPSYLEFLVENNAPPVPSEDASERELFGFVENACQQMFIDEVSLQSAKQVFENHKKRKFNPEAFRQIENAELDLTALNTPMNFNSVEHVVTPEAKRITSKLFDGGKSDGEEEEMTERSEPEYS